MAQEKLKPQQSNAPKAQSQYQTAQQYHLRAAQLHVLASLHHKEAARHLDGGDHRAAVHHAQMANGYVVQAMEQGSEAGKRHHHLHSV